MIQHSWHKKHNQSRATLVSNKICKLQVDHHICISWPILIVSLRLNWQRGDTCGLWHRQVVKSATHGHGTDHLVTQSQVTLTGTSIYEAVFAWNRKEILKTALCRLQILRSSDSVTPDNPIYQESKYSKSISGRKAHLGVIKRKTILEWSQARPGSQNIGKFSQWCKTVLFCLFHYSASASSSLSTFGTPKR